MAHSTEHAQDSRPIKVLVLIPTLNFGGAEMDLVRNLPRMDRARFEIVVCAFLARGSLAQPLLDGGIEVIGPMLPRPPRLSAPLPPGRTSALAGALRRLAGIVTPFHRAAGSALTYLHLSQAVSEYVRKEKIDIVHAILPNAYLVGGLATLRAGRRLLVMSRVSLNWYHAQLRLLGFIERRLLHRIVDAVICNSGAILQELLAEGVSPSKIRLIPNGIDVEAISNLEIDRRQARNRLGIPQDALVFGVVANFFEYKGHADLLRALWIVRDRLPFGWILVAVGRDVDGNLARMQRLCVELGLSDHVRFLGERDDVAVILRATDIHISASHTEGFPNNVLEAMCASLPVVATAVGGVPEMVIDGRTGLLVPAQNPDLMANAVLQLAHDLGRRRAMGEAGRILVGSSFSLERSVKALENLYAEITVLPRPSAFGRS